ncbi:MAG: sugar ABC transporter ATP-binding protein [Oscillospiraceae bacterium]|jgi:ribose transport system ATP-binding protein|nr:sugar ABC transporter ATP-binding protein [Oscillospiraceae bacterium]
MRPTLKKPERTPDGGAERTVTFEDRAGKSLLRTEGVYKQFNGVTVLRDVALDVRYGEVHALMGENGAGKSTIIKIITGVYEKDAGRIMIDGEPVEINDSHDARRAGISVIYQELSLVPALTVAENIFLGQEPGRYGVTGRSEMRERVSALIDRYGFRIDPDAVVDSLGMSQRQMVEILKALSTDAKLVIMDEPTSSLSTAESERLFETIDLLRQKGVGILYVSHRLEEVYRLSDRLTVMRGGEVVGVLDHDEIVPKTVTTMMIGREIRDANARRGYKIYEDNVLEVSHLRYGKLLRDVSFKAYGGEILGIGGLVGSGRTELVKCIYGALRRSGGDVTYRGAPVSKSIGRNIRAGFGFVPEDRRVEGLFPALSIGRNITVASHDKLSRVSVMNKGAEQRWAEEAIKNYDIRPRDRGYRAANLSGGNQQKVVLGRWLAREPDVLLLDEPTVGVDVGVRAELYEYVRFLASRGSIIIMVSSDLFELTHIADRILVMHGGVFFEEFTGAAATQAAVLLAASGQHTDEGVALI